VVAYDDFDDDDFDEFSGPSRSDDRSRSRSRGTSYLFAGLLVGGLTIVLCCGGGTALVVFFMNVMTKEVEVELRDNEVLIEHLGPIVSFELDWTGSFAKDDDEVFVFQVEGTKGKGEITAKSVTGPDDNEHVEWAKLRLPTGEVVDLVPEE
jgi:hypothetical protein